MKYFWIPWILLAAHLEMRSAYAKVSVGEVDTREDWIFLDRFCFLSLDGLFKYEIEYDESQGTPSLLMYPDLQWDDAYKNPKAKTCDAKVGVLIPEQHQIIPLSLDFHDSGCERLRTSVETTTPSTSTEAQKNESAAEESTLSNSRHRRAVKQRTTKILCINRRQFATARERWWFIAISNCNSSGIRLRYTFKMTNGKPGDFSFEHFSADEFYILPCLTSFTFIYLFLLFTALVFAVELKCRQLFHVTYKIFLTSLGMQSVGLILLTIFYARFASTGETFSKLKLAGRNFEAVSEFLLLLLVLLLAKGFTVTRGRLRLPSAIKLTLFLSLYAVIHTFLFFFQEYFFDPGKVLYIYESPAGYGLLTLRLLGWGLFIYGIIFTLKHYPEKSPFYLPFSLLYSLWFISGPIIILTANHLIDSWVREKTSIITEHIATFLAHLFFLFLTRPSAANQSFPYHVRTTQVGADLSSSAEPLNFESHSYAPSVIDALGRQVDVFTVTGVLQRRLEAHDVFSAAGPSNAGVPPAYHRGPPPKYEDAFPHEKPGEVAEILKEDSEDEDSQISQRSGPPPPRRASREQVYTIQ